MRILALFGLAACSAAPPDRPPELVTQTFLRHPAGPGAYAIPKLLVTSGGTALVVAQARRGGDWAKPIDPIVVRSEDGGKSWSEPRKLYEEPAEERQFHIKPTGIVEDGESGRVFVFLVRSPLRNGAGEPVRETWFYENIQETRRLGRAWFVVHSDDDGRTWSPPVDVTAQLIVEPHWQEWSPVHVGIQLRRGTHRGRLIVPVRIYCPERDPSQHDLAFQTNGVIFSDDGGRTWTPGGRTQPYHGECSVVELSDGAVYLNDRQSAGRPRERTFSVSRDGGVSFAEHGAHADLPDQHCHAGLARYDPRTLLFSNVPGPKREGLAVSMSRDDGTTWSYRRVIEPGPAAYSSLAVMSDRTILCVYETGDNSSRRDLAMARFNLAWVMAGTPLE